MELLHDSFPQWRDEEKDINNQQLEIVENEYFELDLDLLVTLSSRSTAGSTTDLVRAMGEEDSLSPEERQSDTEISVFDQDPQEWYFSHEVGHVYFNSLTEDYEFENHFLKSCMSEMFAEATAYHTTGYQNVEERDPFYDAESLYEELSQSENIYDKILHGEFTDEQEMFDWKHEVGCLLGQIFVEEGGDPMNILDNLSEYEERMSRAVKATISYVTEEENPQLDEFQQVYRNLV